MDWQLRLIDTYTTLCDFFNQGLSEVVRRHSNNNLTYQLTDPEVITIFFNGIAHGHFTLKAIFKYTKNHLSDWFPDLAGYDAFCHRLRVVSDIFPILIEVMIENSHCKRLFNNPAKLIDSMPIVLAKASRSGKARVAKDEIADKGYCGSKKEFYYGVKLHVVGDEDDGLPEPLMVGLSAASIHDLKAFEHIVPEFFNCSIYGDKAYCNNELQEQSLVNQSLSIRTPIKLSRSKKQLTFFEKLYSKSVSSIRQPIESFFNWLQEKTRIHEASKVRLFEGLKVHVFGRFAAAMMILRQG